MNTPTTREELVKLIYSNGGNSPATIQFYSDGGHGWLQVPKGLLTELRIADKITRYSYQDATFVYLEEDCDLSIFFAAMQLNENKLSQDFWNIVPDHYNTQSPIRNKASYKAAVIQELQPTLF